MCKKIAYIWSQENRLLATLKDRFSSFILFQGRRLWGLGMIFLIKLVTNEFLFSFFFFSGLNLKIRAVIGPLVIDWEGKMIEKAFAFPHFYPLYLLESQSSYDKITIESFKRRNDDSLTVVDFVNQNLELWFRTNVRMPVI